MKISGVIPLRNAVTFDYPFVLAVRSLQMLCDEVVVLVDPTSEDSTLSAVTALCPDKIVESVWDMSNHWGHTNCEISIQTAKACAAATGDWIFSLQADEVLHENSICGVRKAVEVAEQSFVDHGTYAATGIELQRLYFYGSLDRVRDDWTIWLLRLFKRGLWKPDVDGAMRFDPIESSERRWQIPHCIYHYSRVGSPEKVAERVRNLDRFFHAPEKVMTGKLPPYDFGALRKLDTYVIGSLPDLAEHARLIPFAIEDHPKAAQEYFR